MKGLIKDMGLTLSGELNITLTVPRVHQAEVAKLLDEPVSVELKKYRERRSLTQNAYAWSLITKIAQSINPPMNKEEVYAEMLKRYGQGGIISVQKDKVSDVMRAFDYYVQKGEGEVNGKQFLHMMVYVGSSQYDTKEMSMFVSGIVEEAKDLGIETMTPDEIARLQHG